jgi:hypothetical protein
MARQAAPRTDIARPRVAAHARMAARLAASALLIALTGCGGGVYLSFSDDGDGDRPPDVSLTTAVTQARAGDVVRLAAAASDDFGVTSVRLYQLLDDGHLRLPVADTARPLQWDVTLPESASGQLRYLARATDDIGQQSDSNVVAITLLP